MPKVQSNMLYKTLVEHMNEAIWVGDDNERTVYANPKFCKIMEYSLEEMLGRKSYDFWDKKSAEKVKNVNNTERKQGVSSSYEGKLLSKSGKKTPVLLSGAALPQGGTIGIMTDITAIKEKKLLEKANKQLKELDKIKDSFIGIVTHELRTPLTIMKGYAEILTSVGAENLKDDQKMYLKKILKNASDLIEMVNDTLDITKFSSGEMKLNVEDLQINNFVQGMCDEFMGLYKKKKLDLKLEYLINKDKRIHTDEMRLRQVFRNLLSNAYKFTPEEGSVTIQVEPYKEDNDYYLCSVSDTGIGIPENDQHLVFEMFQQIHNPLQKDYKGTGLGMPIVKKIVEFLGGEIWFNSESNKGTTFNFTIGNIDKKI
ncbi:PAS domain-containing sensor histidine kinase [Candidatus Peregrinibacteria bacterium]|jgi:PAS domain S-box-containing protein|nr:PAS domain-containing sensor histidine kinase [Candidatus Peregrinibacteria bacterium]